MQRRWPSGLVAVCLGISASVSPGFLFGSLFVEMRRELHYSDTVSGLLVSSFFGASALLSAPLGRWVDQRGPGHTLRIGLVAAVVLQSAIAIGGRTIPIIIGVAMLAGCANALCQVSANVWIADNVPPHRQGVAFAAKQSSMPGAALLAGLALPVLAIQLGWRVAFLTGVALGLSALVLLSAIDRRTTGVGAGTAAPIDTDGLGVLDGDLIVSTHDTGVLPSLAVAAALSSAAAVTLGSFFVNSAIHSGIEKGNAGLLLALGSLISIVSRVLAGALADRRDGALLGLVAAMLAIGAASYLLLALGTPIAHLAALPLAFGAGWAWPGVFNLSVVRSHPEAPGRATGITQSGTYVGASMGPLLFGVLADHVSYRGAWFVAALIAAFASAAALNAKRLLVRSNGRRLASTPL